jgi:hypothetical protein
MLFYGTRTRKITKNNLLYSNYRKHYRQDVVSDGDIHVMIKLDKPYQYYGTETGSRQGKIVAEAICQKQDQYPKAIEVCKGITQGFLTIPSKNKHVFVTKSCHRYEDNLKEIHPISIYTHP